MRAEELTKEAELFKAPGDAYVHIELSDASHASIIFGGETASIITALYAAIQRLAVSMSVVDGKALKKDILYNMKGIIKSFGYALKLDKKYMPPELWRGEDYEEQI